MPIQNSSFKIPVIALSILSIISLQTFANSPISPVNDSSNKARALVDKFTQQVKRPTPGQIYQEWTAAGLDFSFKTLSDAMAAGIDQRKLNDNLGGNYQGQEGATILAAHANLIVSLEKIMPNHILLPLGRDTLDVTHILGAYFATIGDAQKVVDIPISTQALGSEHLLGRYLEENGVTLDPNVSSRPWVLIDYTSYSVYSQSRRVTDALIEHFTTQYPELKKNEKILELISFASTTNGVLGVRDYKSFKNNYIKAIKGKEFPSTAWNFPAQVSWDTTEWNDAFHMLTEKNGKIQINTRLFDINQRREHVLSMLLALHLVQTPEFGNAMAKAMAKFDYQIELVTVLDKLKKGKPVSFENLVNELLRYVKVSYQDPNEKLKELVSLWPKMSTAEKSQLKKSLSQTLTELWLANRFNATPLISLINRLGINNKSLQSHLPQSFVESQLLQQKQSSEEQLASWLMDVSQLGADTLMKTLKKSVFNSDVKVAPYDLFSKIKKALDSVGLSLNQQMELLGIIISSPLSTAQQIDAVTQSLLNNENVFEYVAFTSVANLINYFQIDSNHKGIAAERISLIQKRLQSSEKYNTKVKETPASLIDVINAIAKVEANMNKSLAAEPNPEKQDEIADHFGKEAGQYIFTWVERDLAKSGQALAQQTITLLKYIYSMYKENNILRGRDYKVLLLILLQTNFADAEANKIISEYVLSNDYLQQKLSDVVKSLKKEKASSDSKRAIKAGVQLDTLIPQIESVLRGHGRSQCERKVDPAA